MPEKDLGVQGSYDLPLLGEILILQHLVQINRRSESFLHCGLGMRLERECAW